VSGVGLTGAWIWWWRRRRRHVPYHSFDNLSLRFVRGDSARNSAGGSHQEIETENPGGTSWSEMRSGDMMGSFVNPFRPPDTDTRVEIPSTRRISQDGDWAVTW